MPTEHEQQQHIIKTEAHSDRLLRVLGTKYPATGEDPDAEH